MAHNIGTHIEDVQASFASMIPQLEAGLSQGSQRVERLAQTIVSNEESQSRLRSSLVRCVAESASATDIAHGCSDTMTATVERSEEFASNVSQSIQAAVNGLNTLRLKLRANINRAKDDCQESLDNHDSQLQANLQDLQRTRDEHAEATDENDSKLAAFRQQQQLLNHAILEASEQLSAALNAALRDATQEQQDVLQTACDETSEKIRSLLGEELVTWQTELDDFVKQLVEELKTAVAEVAENFMERGNELVDDLRDHTEQQVQSEIEGMFQNVLEDCVAEFMEELVETYATTQLGVSTSAATTPIIPELVVAERLLELIKNYL